MLIDKIIDNYKSNPQKYMIYEFKKGTIEIVILDMAIQVFKVEPSLGNRLKVENKVFFKWKENKKEFEKYLKKYLDKYRVEEIMEKLKHFWFHT